jgi:hypothetical protein
VIDRAGPGAARRDRGAHPTHREPYAFGDSTAPRERLALGGARVRARVARVPRECRERAARSRSTSAAVPDHTTELVAGALGAQRCVGLDASPPTSSAVRRAPAHCEFLCHDALATPYPTGRADTIYARFLVTHLARPAAAIAGFASQLAPRGVCCSTRSSRSRARRSVPRYLALVAAVLASQAVSVCRPRDRRDRGARPARGASACASSPSTRATRPVCSR